MAIDPVPGLRKALNMGSHEVAKLNKGAYGLIDAPYYLWYCALVSELLNLQFEACHVHLTHACSLEINGSDHGNTLSME